MYLYIFYNPITELTKIGITDDLFRRLKQIEMSSGVPLELISYAFIENAFETERYIHSLFKNKRKVGEWFELNETDAHTLKYIWDFLINKDIFHDVIKFKNIDFYIEIYELQRKNLK